MTEPPPPPASPPPQQRDEGRTSVRQRHPRITARAAASSQPGDRSPGAGMRHGDRATHGPTTGPTDGSAEIAPTSDAAGMPRGNATARRLHIGPFELDRADRTLRRDGQALPIGSRGFDILDRLAQANGAGVAAEQLHRTVWAGRAVGQNNLRVQISLLRRVLGAHAVRHDFARGYWLTLPVREANLEAQSQTPTTSAAPDENILG